MSLKIRMNDSPDGADGLKVEAHWLRELRNTACPCRNDRRATTVESVKRDAFTAFECTASQARGFLECSMLLSAMSEADEIA